MRHNAMGLLAWYVRKIFLKNQVGVLGPTPTFIIRGHACMASCTRRVYGKSHLPLSETDSGRQTFILSSLWGVGSAFQSVEENRADMHGQI